MIITETKNALNYSVIYKGFKYDFGTGGLHGAISPSVIESDDDYVLLDSDVSSYYPNLSITNRFHPEHLGEIFCDVYKEIYDTRSYAKKHGPEYKNQGLKLSLNGVFGKAGDKYSPMHDQKFLIQITINGQLLLAMWCEQLQDAGFQPIFVNTDGICFKVPRNRLNEYYQICKKWEETTGLSLEHNEYKKVILQDVNNYLAIDYNNKPKFKGLFEINKDWHKDPSFRIIPLSLYEYFTNNVQPLDVVRNIGYNSDQGTTDIYDYCGRIKSKAGYQIEYRYLEDNEEKLINLQKTNRAFISNSGGYLYKYKDGKRNSVYKGQKVTLFNDYFDPPYDIKYSWYEKEIQKIIDSVEPKQLTLF